MISSIPIGNSFESLLCSLVDAYIYGDGEACLNCLSSGTDAVVAVFVACCKPALGPPEESDVCSFSARCEEKSLNSFSKYYIRARNSALP